MFLFFFNGTPTTQIYTLSLHDALLISQHRPIRVRVTIQLDGKPVGEMWQAALSKAFDHFDRDGDGYLNGYEVQNVFSPTAMASDRKSTRLNSSHTVISYAVFCLKKKKR